MELFVRVMDVQTQPCGATQNKKKHNQCEDNPCRILRCTADVKPTPALPPAPPLLPPAQGN